MIAARSAFLALYARREDSGLVHIDGAFLTRLWTLEPPFTGVIAIVVEVETDEPSVQHLWTARMVFDGDGEEVGRIEGTVTLGGSTFGLVAPMALLLRRPGDYTVNVNLNGDSAAAMPLHLDILGR